LRPVPVIRLHRALTEPSRSLHGMGIVIAYDPLGVGIVQCERVTQAMRPLFGRLDPLDFKFDKVALFISVHPTVKIQQKLKRMDLLLVHSLPYHDMIWCQNASIQWARSHGWLH
jgi:hypothetical protein